MKTLQKDIKALQCAIKMFHLKDGIYSIINNSFFDMQRTLIVQRNPIKGLCVPGKHLVNTLSLFSCVVDDIWNIAITIERLEFLRNMAEKNNFLMDRWNLFAQCDIEHVYYDLRSIMDYIAEIIAGFYNVNGKMPSSFDRLRERLIKGEYKKTFEPIIINLIVNAHWFCDVRGLRNNIKSKGAFAIVFDRPNKGIQFQVMKGFETLVNNLPFPYINKNHVVDYKKYIALYFARLLTFLDDLGTLFYKYHPELKTWPGSINSPGFSLFYNWMRELLVELQSINKKSFRI